MRVYSVHACISAGERRVYVHRVYVIVSIIHVYVHNRSMYLQTCAYAYTCARLVIYVRIDRIDPRA